MDLSLSTQCGRTMSGQPGCFYFSTYSSSPQPSMGFIGHRRMQNLLLQVVPAKLTSKQGKQRTQSDEVSDLERGINENVMSFQGQTFWRTARCDGNSVHI